MINNIEGLVIRIKDYKDNDQILDVLTPKYGVISLIARGTKKPGSKLHYLISSKYDFSFDYKDNKSIFMIINSSLIKSNISYDDALINAFVSIFYEIIVRFKDMTDLNTYYYLDYILNNINHKNYFLLGSIFMSFILKSHGINPYVDGCVVCNKKKVVSINNDLGGFVCEGHNEGNIPLDVDLLKQFRIICKAGYKDMDSIINMDVSEDVFNAFMQFFIYNNDVKLKTYDFFMRLI